MLKNQVLIALGILALGLAALGGLFLRSSVDVSCMPQDLDSPDPSNASPADSGMISDVAWFSVDSTGRIVDYALAVPGENQTCPEPLDSQPAPDALDSGNVAVSSVVHAEVTTEQLNNVKWWKVNSSGIITEYGLFAPSPIARQCVAQVFFVPDGEGWWVFESANCLNPCAAACYFCEDEPEPGTTRYWCACSTVNCEDFPG